MAELGKINVLINNVGGGGPNDPRKVTGKAVGEMLAFNVVPAALIQKAAAAVEASNWRDYRGQCSSTAALLAEVLQCLRCGQGCAQPVDALPGPQGFGPKVRINAIEPGTIMTDALAPFLTLSARSAWSAPRP